MVCDEPKSQIEVCTLLNMFRMLVILEFNATNKTQRDGSKKTDESNENTKKRTTRRVL